MVLPAGTLGALPVGRGFRPVGAVCTPKIGGFRFDPNLVPEACVNNPSVVQWMACNRRV